MPKKADKAGFWNAVGVHHGVPLPTTITRQQIKKIVDESNGKIDWPHWLTNDQESYVGDGKRGEYYTPGNTPTTDDGAEAYEAPEVEASTGEGEVIQFEANAARRKPRASSFVTRSPEELGNIGFNNQPSKDVGDMKQSVAVIETLSGDGETGVTLHESLVPEIDPAYVPFGHYDKVDRIIDSGIFYPIYVTGLSGNGKTFMIDQVAAKRKRELVRANITIETDEDDLLGGFRLIDGKTVWQNGPAVIAMMRGGILLLDEVDLGSNKLMCLQPILEGKGVYLKKINQFVKPQPGFNIFATANTKGQGSADGKFIGTNVLNEAFLERFAATLEQDYPPEREEMKILQGHFKKAMAAAGHELDDQRKGLSEDFFMKLIKWGNQTRGAYRENVSPDLITTRRLVHISQAYTIFGFDRKEALDLGLARFETETRKSFWEAYQAFDDNIKERPIATVADRIAATPGAAPNSGASAETNKKWQSVLAGAPASVKAAGISGKPVNPAAGRFGTP